MKKVTCDIVAVVGGAVCVYGAWLAWHPLGYMLGGCAAAVSAVFVSYSDAKGGRR